MSNNKSVVAGTVIVEIVDDGSSFRGGGGQNNNTNTHATTNNDERNYEKRETRVRRSSSGPSSTSLPTPTNNSNNNNIQTRRATRVVQNATVFVNETVEQFLERCLERRKSRDKEDLINATTKTISSTFGTGGKRNVSVPQLFWSSCPLSVHERLDKLESTKPWQLNLKKGDSRLTLRVKDFQEWTVSVKRMTSAKNPLVFPRAEEKEKEKGGDKRVEEENAGEKGEKLVVSSLKKEDTNTKKKKNKKNKKSEEKEEEEVVVMVGEEEIAAENVVKEDKEEEERREMQQQEQQQEQNQGQVALPHEEAQTLSPKKIGGNGSFVLNKEEEEKGQKNKKNDGENDDEDKNKEEKEEEEDEKRSALTTTVIHEKKEPESGEKRRAEEEEEEDDDEEARVRERLLGNAEDDKAKDKNDDEDDYENLNEMQMLQKDAMAVYNARVGKRGGVTKLTALLEAQEREELNRKYRETIENVLKSCKERKKTVKEHANTDRPPARKNAKKSSDDQSVYNNNNNNNNNNNYINYGATKSPAGQLEHYQTILKATQLLVQKERQKALVMKILQHAPRIPDTPSDFEALISGKDACLKYKPPPVPEFVPPPPPADAREHKHPYSNDDRGSKRMRNINDLNDSLPTMFSYDNKRAKSNADSRSRSAAKKRAALQSPEQLAKKQEFQRRQQQYFQLQQQQLHQQPKNLHASTRAYKERRPADKISPEFEKALMKKKQEIQAMHGDIGAMDGLLKLAHAANVSNDTQRLQQQDWARANAMLKEELKRAKKAEEDRLQLQILQEEREREKRQTVSMSSNDDSMQINEDGMHENSARAYSEALEQARENPGAFLRRKEEEVKPKKTKRPTPPALYVQKLLEMQMQQKLAKLRDNNHVQAMKDGATLANADMMAVEASIPSPNYFGINAVPVVKLPPPPVIHTLPTNVGNPNLSALDEQQRIEMLVQARVQQELMQHRAGLPSIITQVQQQLPPQQMPEQSQRAILQPQPQPHALQTTMRSFDTAQQNILQAGFQNDLPQNDGYSKQLENVSKNLVAPKQVAYTNAMAELADVNVKRARELGIKDDSSDEISGSDVRINNIDSNVLPSDAPKKTVVDMEMVMKAIKRHAAQDGVFKQLRSIYDKKVAEFLRVKNGGVPAVTSTEKDSSVPPPVPITPAWTKTMMEAERAQQQQTEMLINLIKVQMKAAEEAPNEGDSVEALSRMLNALNQRQQQPPLIDPFEGMTEEEIEEEAKQAVREVPPKTTKTAPVAPRVPAQPLIQRPTIVAKTVEAKTIEGDEEATTPPIQEPMQTVEERPFSDAENEKEKRD
ncbi:unnamed protein product [Bathycoccus prasinos]